jgi:DNA-binding LacI/PurR family transcriptional regulator
MAKVTIEDISRSTGLSRGTVSRALNDRPDISSQTKQRVLEACRRLNYVPSQAARSLATGRSFAVAVVADDLADALALAFLRGVLARAEAANYAVYVLELGSDPGQRRERIQRLAHERIDSVLIAAELDAGLVAPLSEAMAGRPTAACLPVDGLTGDVLAVDQVESGRLLARHLIDRCGMNVLYVHSDRPRFAAERLAGFRAVLEQRGIDPSAAIINVPSNASADALAELVGGPLSRAQGVGATDDALAIDVMLAALRSGRRPGRDVAIGGQGNGPVSSQVHPSLTTTDFAGEETGRRAMDLVLQRLGKTRMDAPERVGVTPTLIERGSTSRS